MQKVLVDRSAQRLVFTVQWAPPTRQALDVEVFRPNCTAAVPDSSGKTPQSSTKMFNVKPSDVGTWTVRVKRGLNQSTEPVPYVLQAMVREHHLDYLLSTTPGRPATGDKITVRPARSASAYNAPPRVSARSFMTRAPPTNRTAPPPRRPATS